MRLGALLSLQTLRKQDKAGSIRRVARRRLLRRRRPAGLGLPSLQPLSPVWPWASLLHNAWIDPRACG